MWLDGSNYNGFVDQQSGKAYGALKASGVGGNNTSQDVVARFPFGVTNYLNYERTIEYIQYSYLLAYPNGKKPEASESGGHFKGNITDAEVYEVPGKVIMERITDVKAITDGRSIDFEWIIESRIPPTKIMQHTALQAGQIGAYDGYPYWFTPSSFSSNQQQTRAVNAPIENIYVSIRVLKGTSTSSGGIKVTEPFNTTNYEEVGYITVPVSLLKMDYLDIGTLNDTNKGTNGTQYSNSRGQVVWSGLVDWSGATKKTWIDPNGYGKVKIRVKTDGSVKLMDPTGTTEKDTLVITWVNGYKKFENKHYYFTVQPRNSPMERLKTLDMGKPSDGYLPIEKIWPLDYRGNSQVGAGGGIENTSLPGGKDAISTWKVIQRFTPGLPKDGGWTKATGTKNWMAATLLKLENGTPTSGMFFDYSDNDKKVASKTGGDSNFYNFGFVCKSATENLSESSYAQSEILLRATKQDLIDQNAEHFAWFKVADVPTQPKNVPDWDTKFNIKHDPTINKNLDPVLTTSQDGLTFTAKISGYFQYIPTMINSSSGPIALKSSDGFPWGMDVYLPTDFKPPYFAEDYTIYPDRLADIRKKYFVEKDGQYYGKIKRTGDMPISCGFRYRKQKTTAWTDITVASGLNVDTAAIAKYIVFRPKMADEGGNVYTQDFLSQGVYNFESFLVDKNGQIINIPVKDKYEYQVWVKKVDGTYYYAAPTLLEKDAKNYPITLGSTSLSSFPQPQSNINGHWYQVFDSWSRPAKIINGSPVLNSAGQPVADDSRQFSPYLTVRPEAPEGVAKDWPYNKYPGLFPVHYYMNYEFSGDNQYQIRTIVENFYGGQKRTNVNVDTLKTPDVLLLTTPWGEEYQYNTGMITLPSKLNTNGTIFPGSPKNINLYMTTNINAFIGDKTTPNKPIKSINSTTNPQNPITYSAYPSFNKSSLAYFEIYESDWILQGQAVWNVMTQNSNGKVYPIGTQKVPWFDTNGQPVGGKGWHFITSRKMLTWFDTVPPNTAQPSPVVSYKDSINNNLPMGGDVNDFFSAKDSGLPYYLINNFAAKFIPYQTFNVTFTYVNSSDFEMTLYLGGQLPYRKSETEWWITDIDELIEKNYVKKVADLSPLGTGVKECKFVGLVGNQYMFFVARPIIKFFGDDKQKVDQNFGGPGNKFFNTNLPSGYSLSNGKSGFGTYSVISLYDFKFSGSYHQENNTLFDVDENLDYTIKKIEGATYSMVVGIGNNVVADAPNTSITILSKAGSGTFNSGIWENGVWNNGWRDDHTVREFFNVESFYLYDYNSRCKIRINGPASSVAAFSVGDNVSISNMVAVDMNEDRRLLKNFYTISEKSSRWIEVDLSVEFSLMRVEIDSDEHRILVTKNIWMNGVFFNGYFSGVWNNGLFSGYPMITKMAQTHWIDGIFNGGHFVAKKLKLEINTIKQNDFENYPRLGVTTKEKHDLQVGDIVSIIYNTKDTEATFGTTKIIQVIDDLNFTTALPWEADIKAISNSFTSATVLTIISDGLIQNFEFYSNNVSTVTSIESLLSQRVFSYNSWIDVNYSNQSGVNVGRPENYNDPTSGRPYSENNLFGYPTNDVLSSKSVFRDSFSTTYRQYKLGRKYKLVSDFIGQSSTFEDYFDQTDSTAGAKLFNEQGWDFDLMNDTDVYILSGSQSEGANSPYYVSLFLPEDGYANKIKTNDSLTLKGPFVTPSGSIGLNKYPDSKIAQKTATFTVSDVKQHENSREIVTSLTQSRPYYDPNNTAYLLSLGSGYWDVSSKPNTSIPFLIGLPTNNNLVFSRTNEPNNAETKLKGKELRIETTDKGGVLNLIPADGVIGRINTDANTTISKQRYSMVEFDVVQVDYATASSFFYEDDLLGKLPPIHFNNLNVVTRERSYSGTKVTEKKIASYLPIYKNVNHITTIGTKKQEFFFNKRNLLMNFTGTGQFGFNKTDFYIDNLKLYETDMIPFFQYFNNPYLGIGGNINNSVQIPNSTLMLGPSPEIESGEDNTNDKSVQDYYNGLITPLLDIPQSINWQRDYVIYKTQDIDYDQLAGIYDVNTLTILKQLQANTSMDPGSANPGGTNVDTKDKGSLTVAPGSVSNGNTV